MFCMILMLYFHFYIFVFLAEKFFVLTLQQVNYVSVSSALVGYVIFMLGMYNWPRRRLNLLVSGSVLALSAMMLVCSGLASELTLNGLGLLSMCTCRPNP